MPEPSTHPRPNHDSQVSRPIARSVRHHGVADHDSQSSVSALTARPGVWSRCHRETVDRSLDRSGLEPAVADDAGTPNRCPLRRSDDVSGSSGCHGLGHGSPSRRAALRWADATACGTTAASSAADSSTVSGSPGERAPLWGRLSAFCAEASVGDPAASFGHGERLLVQGCWQWPSMGHPTTLRANQPVRRQRRRTVDGRRCRAGVGGHNHVERAAGAASAPIRRQLRTKSTESGERRGRRRARAWAQVGPDRRAHGRVAVVGRPSGSLRTRPSRPCAATTPSGRGVVPELVRAVLQVHGDGPAWLAGERSARIRDRPAVVEATCPPREQRLQTCASCAEATLAARRGRGPEVAVAWVPSMRPVDEHHRPVIRRTSWNGTQPVSIRSDDADSQYCRSVCQPTLRVTPSSTDGLNSNWSSTAGSSRRRRARPPSPRSADEWSGPAGRRPAGWSSRSCEARRRRRGSSPSDVDPSAARCRRRPRRSARPALGAGDHVVAQDRRRDPPAQFGRSRRHRQRWAAGTGRPSARRLWSPDHHSPGAPQTASHRPRSASNGRSAPIRPPHAISAMLSRDCAEPGLGDERVVGALLKGRPSAIERSSGPVKQISEHSSIVSKPLSARVAFTACRSVTRPERKSPPPDRCGP